MKRYLLGLVVFGSLVGCGTQVVTDPSILKEGLQTEANHKKLVSATPPPQFDHSLERENLVRRLKTLNVQNKVMYVYCMTMDGKVVMQSLVQGKVSSINSLLTTPEQIIQVRNGSNWWHEKMPSPDFDGSYGKNPEAIFWFTPEGEYCEWSGYYFLSDRPRNITTPVSLTTTVDLEKKGK